MCDDDIHQHQTDQVSFSRRAFGLMAAASAGLSATFGAGRAAAAAEAAVVETDVNVKTPDGVCDAVLFHPPGKGTWPAVLVWTDIMGLRPVFRDMGRRLAAQGYVVLVPNPFYRGARAPVVGPDFDFSKPEGRAKLMGFRSAMTDAAVDSDAKTFVAFLDAQPQTNKKALIGVQGYCMGGPLTFRTTAVAAHRVGAAATFHGGGLVAKDPADPASLHRLIPTFVHAEVYCAVAANDDKAQPEAKDVLRKALADAKVPGKVEVYDGCAHGWTVKGSAVYDAVGAERAWAELTALYKRRLV
jgi:carboxymethylenebutenolidase